MSTPSSSSPPAEQGCDRSITTPFLLRCFWSINYHNKEADYKQVANEVYPSNEVPIYTWRDATLKEVSAILKESINECKYVNCQFDYSIVYPDKRGVYVVRPLGSVHTARAGSDDGKTLSVLKLQPGDFLDVAIHPVSHPNK